jgi:plasmid stabilization system protein ParE
MMRVLLHEKAIRDLREIVEQLSEDSAKAVEQFYSEFDSAADFVARHPEVGHPCRRFRRWNFKRFPFHLLYEALSGRGEIWIMVVRHDRRHPSYGMKRRIPDPWLT